MCIRTTMDIDDHLLRKVKELAARQGTSVKRLVEAALREHLLAPKSRREPFRFRPLTKRGRPVPGVNVADRDALYERMDGRG
jgi:hypothetical protein